MSYDGKLYKYELPFEDGVVVVVLVVVVVVVVVVGGMSLSMQCFNMSCSRQVFFESL